MTQEFDTPELSKPREDAEPPITSADFASEAQSSLDETPAAETASATHSAAPVVTLSDELRALNLAIEIYPEAAANFAARGDYFRRQRERILAVDDYRQALALAEKEMAESRWGLVAQAIRDHVLNTLSEMGER